MGSGRGGVKWGVRRGGRGGVGGRWRWDDACQMHWGASCLIRAPLPPPLALLPASSSPSFCAPMAPGTSTPSLPHTYPARPTHSWRRATIAQLSKIAIESILDLKSVTVLKIATAGLVPLLTAAMIAHAAVRAPARTWARAAAARQRRPQNVSAVATWRASWRAR